jgi:hypothetical protein
MIRLAWARADKLRAPRPRHDPLLPTNVLRSHNQSRTITLVPTRARS